MEYYSAIKKNTRMLEAGKRLARLAQARAASRPGPPTPVFLPGESHGQRSLMGYSHGVAKESGQNTGVGSLSLLQGIFPIQGSNPGLPHCSQIIYQLIHQGSSWWVCHFAYAAAAAAKSLQPCPTLCDPIDGSPPGSPIPGILQARRQEGRFPCFVCKGFPTFTANLRMRPVSRGNSRCSLVGGTTC